MHNDNFQSYQPKLHITVTQSKTTFSLSTQPVPVQITTSSAHNALRFHSHRPEVSSAIRQ